MFGPRFDGGHTAAVGHSLSLIPKARAGHAILLVMAIAIGTSSSTARAQSGESESRRPVPGESDLGAIGRIGHLGFKTFGRDSSITPIEVFPYVVDGQNFFFGDFRGFVSNFGQFGGNFGLG